MKNTCNYQRHIMHIAHSKRSLAVLNSYFNQIKNLNIYKMNIFKYCDSHV